MNIPKPLGYKLVNITRFYVGYTLRRLKSLPVIEYFSVIISYL